MAKLWQKNYDVDKLIGRYTVGDDYCLDVYLVPSDCVASLAHAKMLESIQILTTAEYASLKENLIKIIRLHENGEFPVTLADEDCHTAIENFLTAQCGDAGKKIHTGRSRNDQVIAALRIFSRDVIIRFTSSCLDLIRALLDCADQNKAIPMPGRTHMQIAMPSSVGLWAASFAECLLGDLRLADTAYHLNNTCPLGSAASYGVPLPLDRELVSRLLGFGKVQNNVLYVNNSRGKIESIILEAVDQVMLTLSKLSQDLIIFSMPEFGYFSLPDELCTGSSIMPQKKNPDALELLRAKSAFVSQAVSQLKQIIRSLPSGYNRDFQETKGPFFKAMFTGIASVRVIGLTMQKLKVNKDRLLKAFTPEIFATHAAYELVREGIPFREAYRKVGLNLDALKTYDPEKIISMYTAAGTPGNLCLDLAYGDLEQEKQVLEKEAARVDTALEKLVGFVPDLSGRFLADLY